MNAFPAQAVSRRVRTARHVVGWSALALLALAPSCGSDAPPSEAPEPMESEVIRTAALFCQPHVQETVRAQAEQWFRAGVDPLRPADLAPHEQLGQFSYARDTSWEDQTEVPEDPGERFVPPGATSPQQPDPSIAASGVEQTPLHDLLDVLRTHEDVVLPSELSRYSWSAPDDPRSGAVILGLRGVSGEFGYAAAYRFGVVDGGLRSPVLSLVHGSTSYRCQGHQLVEIVDERLGKADGWAGSSQGPPLAPGVEQIRRTFSHGSGERAFVTVEVLEDDLLHVEYGLGDGHAGSIHASPMVFERGHTGPSAWAFDERTFEGRTGSMRVRVRDDGCVAFASTQGDLSTVCPNALGEDWKGISLDTRPAGLAHAYGLGQNFVRRGSADGDWVRHGVFETAGEFGNHFQHFHGGANGQIQLPVLYAMGDARSFGLFLDNVYKQRWDFTQDWWKVRMFGDQIRFYVMAGADLQDIRSDYLDLTGHPPVPPRKAFGLWMSEFGYDDPREVYCKVFGPEEGARSCRDGEQGLRPRGFPVDGVVLDVQWFGATAPDRDDSRMGSLEWDPSRFPEPGRLLRDLDERGIGVVAIEESYVSKDWWREGFWSQHDMRLSAPFVHVCDTDDLTEFHNWMGHTAMLDWANPDAAALWHDHVRKPNLIDFGVMGHWTDLGEPERYYGDSCYSPVESGHYRHPDIHNLYNFLWHRSIHQGYARNGEQRRPFMLTRAGAPGIQRFGAAMWSGDIASRLDVLATHLNADMHVRMAGIDYYGSDVGGFWRSALKGYSPDRHHRVDQESPSFEPDTEVCRAGDQCLTDHPDHARSDITWGPYDAEMYMQWFANGAWFDIPLRPHAFNCGFDWFPGCGEGAPYYETSPANWDPFRSDSNRANLLQRYALIPYYYSLAHHAYRDGKAVIAPLVTAFPRDSEVREMGHQKLVGPYLMVGAVARHGQYDRDVYLPAGTWIDYHTHAYSSGSRWLRDVPLWRDGIFRLPVFARAGAIVPMMVADQRTRDAYGFRRDGTIDKTLVVQVFAHPSVAHSSFTLVEDDGWSVDRYEDEVPVYVTRDTRIEQCHGTLGGGTCTPSADTVTVRFSPDPDTRFRPDEQRARELRLVTDGRTVVSVDGAAEWQQEADGLLVARTTVDAAKAGTTIVVGLQ